LPNTMPIPVAIGAAMRRPMNRTPINTPTAMRASDRGHKALTHAVARRVTPDTSHIVFEKVPSARALQSARVFGVQVFREFSDETSGVSPHCDDCGFHVRGTRVSGRH
jgi:hypothetical protein